jgi:cysteine-rich repeat protein
LPASSATSAASNTCGNGTQEAGEQCDDNNRNDWDGCAADCTLESEWVLTVNGKISPAFDPKTTEYVVNLPLFVESLELTAKAPHAGKVHVAESVLGTDGTWVSPRLVSGETSVELKVMDGTAERKSIRLRVRRSDAEERSIEASDRMARGAFGTSAALSGDGNTVAIGAEGNSDTANQEGAVYLSTRSETTYWFEQQILKASNAQRGDYFGAAVVMSADGKLLAVGAPYEDGSADASGAVYIFELDGVGKWQQRAYLKASNPGRYALFGGGLALSADGSTLAVGASGESGSGTGISDGKNTDTQAYQSGAVYVFSRNAAGSWEQQAYVKAPNAGAGDLFGSSLALNLDGTVLVVGAPGEESSSRGVSEASSANNDALRAGAAYVFTRSMAGVWVHQSYLKASNSDVNDEFGAAVALSSDGSTVAIGAYRESSANRGVSSGSVTSNEAENSGAVYLFENRTSGWAQIAFVKASNAAAGQFFGRALTLSANGSWLVVGAPDEDGSTPGISDGVNTGEYEEATGAAYLFHRKAGVWSQRAYIKSPDPDGYDAFGGAVMLSGDGQTIAICSKYDDGNANTLYASGSVTIVQ